MYYDTHSHLNLRQFSNDWREVVIRMKNLHVRTTTVGITSETSQFALDQAREFPEILRAIVGIHPAHVAPEDYLELTIALSHIDQMLHDPLCIGAGECGYDFFRISDEQLHEVDPLTGLSLLAMQDDIFIRQIELAVRHNKPLMLHLRPTRGTHDAYDRALDVLEQYRGRVTGQAHFFAGTVDQARRFLDLGFYISCTGVITFTHDYDEVLRFAPIDRILCETDSPYVAPVPHRGGRAEPWQVVEVYKRLAEIKGVSLEELVDQVDKNIQALYKV